MKRSTQLTPAPIKDRIVRFNYKGNNGTVAVCGFYCYGAANNESVTYRDYRPNSSTYGNLFNAVSASPVTEKVANSLKAILVRKGYTVDIIEITPDKVSLDATEYVNI